MPTKNSLLIFRDEINNIDKNIVKLLAKRKKLVLKIAQCKIENNQAIRDVEREKKILEKLIILGEKKHLKKQYITQLFQLIIEESVLTQKELLQKLCNNDKLSFDNFSFLGPKGSYSHIAACEYANRNFKKCIINEYSNFQEVILSVEKNQSDYAVLPIENTCSGSINEVFDLLNQTNLFIIGEINIFINHCLLAIKKIELNEINSVYSHPQPFEQCSRFIEKFPKWKIKYTKSTANAMKKIIKYNKINDAVLGSKIGSKIYGLNILATNLANKERNITRFILLHRNPINYSEKISTKTTLIFSIEKKSNTLNKIILILQEKKLTFHIVYENLSKEIFCIDIYVNLSSILMQDAIIKMKKITKFIKILGCYPIDKIIPITS